ncbi:MAG TPA: hypothetical protein VKT99_15725 [Xanthobacteraceae bacterium]|jgi:hypothetical protein|nr:hypothetical protein [Xanthobacteraceae bacterium]
MGELEDAKFATRRAIAARKRQTAWLQAGGLVREHAGKARKSGASHESERADCAARIHRGGNSRYVSGKMTRVGHKLGRVVVQFAQCRSIGYDEARHV